MLYRCWRIFYFFMYKFKVLNDRSKQINQQNIIDKINRKEDLTANDYYLIRIRYL
jgi:hypothetical protein